MALVDHFSLCILALVVQEKAMIKDLGKEDIKWSSAGALEDRLVRWSEEAGSSRLLRGEALSRRSSLRIGGPARFWAEVGSIKDLRLLLAALGADSFECVGLGSNALFSDDGIDGLVIRLVGDFARWQVREESDGAIAQVMAGAINAHLVRGLLNEGFIGAEFLSLIPGTFGGAVALNAGTKEVELKEILCTVWLATPDEESRCWRVEEVEAAQLGLTYRKAHLPKGAMILGGTIRLCRGDVAQARQRVRDDKERRNRTQPYRLASLGSTFANPDGDFAGRLIEAVKLKGTAFGGARISDHHANFFINEADGSAEDFLRLMALARHRVRQQFGIELRPEVKFVGFDGWAKLLEFEQELDEDDV